jgi:death on curing protein
VLLEIHHDLIENHGGSSGVRIADALAAAVGRGRHVEDYLESADLFDIAAAIAVSITEHRHPFADGNKRVGFVAAVTIIDVNGYHLDVREAEATRVMFDVASGDCDEDRLAAWLRENSSTV